MYQPPIRPNEIYHYGIKRRSGRYSWGSGERPYQDEEYRSVNEVVDVKNISNSGKQYSIKNVNGLIVSEAKVFDWGIEGFDWDLISDVETIPSQRGKGYASALLDKIESDSNKNKGLYLLVKDDNDNAIRLYEKKGFEKIEKYRLSNGDHFVMVKGLADKKQFEGMRFS